MPSFEQNESRSIGILQQAEQRFGNDLWILSSFGVDSALTLHLARQADIAMNVLTIDTGFGFDETFAHQWALEESEDFTTITFNPTRQTVRDITRDELWRTNLDRYNYLTKQEPLARAIRALGVRALVSGVRRDQTAHRSGLATYTMGDNGETRVNAMLDWAQDEVDEYFAAEGLPRHPLYARGYGSVGDWPLTRPGQGRAGRNLGASSECGLNVTSASDPHSLISTQVKGLIVSPI